MTRSFYVLSIIILILALIYTATFRIKEGPVVEIVNGKIRGFVDTSRDGREFYSWLGIQYAKVKRFEPPQPVEDWTDTKLAQSYGSMCPQVDHFSWKVVGEEDCLFINVHSPSNIQVGTLLPVIVYIHGGYFMQGGGQNFLPHYFMDQDIIMVTFNYRVGALGFLSTNDGVISGNMGLKDQVAALHFVKENIEAFGGNPNKVTLFGESAGAASVHFHILSNQSKGLFHRAMSNSGSAIKTWALSTKPQAQAKRLADRLNCPTENSESLINCLRKLSTTEIAATQIESITPLVDALIMYGPTVEVTTGNDKSAFLSEHPYTLLTQGKFSNVPYLTGINSAEGLIITGRIEYDKDLVSQIDADWQSVLPLYLLSPPQDSSLTRQIVEFYLKRPIQPNEKFNFTENLVPLTKMMTDRNYLVATREAALHHASKAPVFLYYNKYEGQWSFTTFFGFKPNIPASLQFMWKLTCKFLTRLLGLHTNKFGPCHGDDLFLLFKVPYMGIKAGSKDYEFSRLLVKTWVSFANADENLNVNGTLWKPLDVNNRNQKLQYLTFESNGDVSMKDEEFTERAEFWHKLNLPWIF